MARYEISTQEVRDIVTEMMNQYHPELRDAGVTVDLLTAFADRDEGGDVKGPAVTLGGYPVDAKISVNRLPKRVLGHADCEITIDGDRWDEKSTGQKMALIDHELTHLELATKLKGEETIILRDDIDRPVLKILKHDHQFGWFDSCVRRHGLSSVEAVQYDTFFEAAYQTQWVPYLS